MGKESDYKDEKAFFIDIDGTVLKQNVSDPAALTYEDTELLPGAAEKIREWHSQGHKIFFTTGRPEKYRGFTVAQLAKVGVPYHLLIMDASRGSRILINNKSNTHSELERAKAYMVEKNHGIEHIDE